MALFFRRKHQPDEAVPSSHAESPDSGAGDIDSGLSKSRSSLRRGLSRLFTGAAKPDEALYQDIEDALIQADVGVEASMSLIEDLRAAVKRRRLATADELLGALRESVAESLAPAEQQWVPVGEPYVVLVVGVNGVGKTTTTAKIAHHLTARGKRVMLAAADTFRAAAVEQLQSWGQRLNIPVIAQASGADAAAVAHDALSAARARQTDVLLIDTAGRLHTQTELMQQLGKINRVLGKIDPHSPHEILQVLDAGTGQNALAQLRHFQEAVGVSSVCVTKLDGTAKGGIVVSLTRQFGLPVRFIGVGEAFEDLLEFRARAFAEALLPGGGDETPAPYQPG